MFFSRHSRKTGYSFCEDACVMIWGHSMTSCIDFCGSTSLDQPVFKMLEHTLVELMQDIWHYRSENMDIWKAFPERINDGLDTSVFACHKKPSSVMARVERLN